MDFSIFSINDYSLHELYLELVCWDFLGLTRRTWGAQQTHLRGTTDALEAQWHTDRALGKSDCKIENWTHIIINSQILKKVQVSLEN